MFQRKKTLVLNQKLCAVSEEFGKYNVHTAFSEVKSLKEDLKPTTMIVKYNHGNIIGEQEGIKSRWKEYFHSLLNGTTSPSQETERPQDLILDEDDSYVIHPPTLEEVKDFLKLLENNKTLGVDKIPAELLKMRGETLLKDTLIEKTVTQ